MSYSRRLAAIMFTDIVGYTSLMQEDEKEAMRYVSIHERLLGHLVPKYNGEIQNLMGDGSLCIFPNATDAVRCAREIQEELQQKEFIPLRIGIHVGEVIIEGSKAYGDGVNLASRIEGAGHEGIILFSRSVQTKILNQPDLSAESVGFFHLKNVDSPMELFALKEKNLLPIDSKKLKNRISTSTFSKRIPWNYLLLAAVGFILIYVMFTKINWNSSEEISDKSIAVLPFTDMSPKGDQDWFSEGISIEIINILSGIKDLDVASRTSSFQYKNKQVDLREIGKTLNVKWIIEGSVSKVNEKVRINTQVINTDDGFELWSKRFDRSYKDVFAIQTEIAENIAEGFQIELNPNEKNKIEKPLTRNAEAYDHYLKANFLYRKGAAEYTRAAIVEMEKAIELDTTFSEAYGDLAKFHAASASWWGDTKPKLAYARALPMAEKALKLNANSTEALRALFQIKWWFERDSEEAERFLRKTIQLTPDNGEPYAHLCFFLNLQGKSREAIKYGKAGVEKDPFFSLCHFFLSDSYRLLGLYDSAHIHLSEVLSLFPNDLSCLTRKGWTYLDEGKYEMAIDFFNGILEGNQMPFVYGFLGSAYAKNGQPAEAWKIADKMKEMRNGGMIDVSVYLAHIYAALNEIDLAFEWLNQSIKDGDVDLIWLKVEKQFEPLHKDPRWTTLLDEVGLWKPNED
jgi:TolB-like protein